MKFDPLADINTNNTNKKKVEFDKVKYADWMGSSDEEQEENEFEGNENS
jgi:hypothetical protein